MERTEVKFGIKKIGYPIVVVLCNQFGDEMAVYVNNNVNHFNL